MGKTASFILGGIFGAACGAVAGMMLAPRAGAESRAMAADAMNDAWDSAVDTYEHGSRVVNDKVSAFRPSVDVATDELRAKVDAARERMNQVRNDLSNSVAATSEGVSAAVDSVTAKVNATIDGISAAQSSEAADVVVEQAEGQE